MDVCWAYTYYFHRNRQAVRLGAVLIVENLRTIELTKVCGSSGQWRGLHSGNCHDMLGNLAPLLTSVIFFIEIYFMIGNWLIHGCSLFLTEYHASSQVINVTLGTYFLHSLQFSMLRMKEIVPRYRIRSPDFEVKSLILSL
jgi:hypothetical protein